jgi:hypothetical protein
MTDEDMFAMQRAAAELIIRYLDGSPRLCPR